MEVLPARALIYLYWRVHRRYLGRLIVCMDFAIQRKCRRLCFLFDVAYLLHSPVYINNKNLFYYIIFSWIIAFLTKGLAYPFPLGDPRPNGLLVPPPLDDPGGRSFLGLPGPRLMFKGFPPGNGNF